MLIDRLERLKAIVEAVWIKDAACAVLRVNISKIRVPPTTFHVVFISKDNAAVTLTNVEINKWHSTSVTRHVDMLSV